MMFSQTLCKPGSYIEVVPIGLLATLQYNKKGLLEKILVNDSEVPNQEFKNLQKFVPNRIHVSGGTTWVRGVFYSDDISIAPGELPTCTYDDYRTRESNFEFYASNAKSLAVSFSGSLATRNWLSIAKFNLLPGIIVPVELKDETLQMMLASGNYKFKYPYIAGFEVFEGLTSKFVPADLCQCTVKSVTRVVDKFGYIMGKVKTDFESLTLNYSDVARYNIQTGTSILYRKDGSIKILAAAKTDSKKREPVSRKLTCPTCGKQILVPNFGPVQCDDASCLSRCYPQVTRMLTVLGLPNMTYERYQEVVSDKSIVEYYDVLLLPEYKDIRPEITLSQVLKAATPTEVCADDSFFDKLTNSCNQSVETLMYYLGNPRRLCTELDIVSIPGQRFIKWISDSSNVLTVQALLNYVEVVSRKKRFDGAPIFRGRKFVITGKFKRGSYEEIAAILESYSGLVLPDMEHELPDCVIIGSMHDGINGRIIQKARLHNIAVAEEDVFFGQYEIDADLAANLL